MFLVVYRFCFCVLLLASARPAIPVEVPGGGAPVAPAASVTLGWTPSPDTNAAGYLLLWGTSRGVYTNQLAVGKTNRATVTGLEANVTYYFSAVAHDAAGRQSPPSNEIAYTVPAGSPTRSPACSPPALTLQLAGTGQAGTALCLRFQANAATTYRLEATQDFIHWQTLATTNCAQEGLVTFYVADRSRYPQRFYRLKVIFGAGPELGIGLQRAGLCLSFYGCAGKTYKVAATRDFLHWETLWTTNCASDGLVLFRLTDPAKYPYRFYRIAQE